MEVELRTLTPLWTGGVEGKSNLIHETGILGSLRWWYEAMVRGLEGYVGDPTAKETAQRSEFDSKAYEQALREGQSKEEALRKGLATLGAVEYLFGTTGWARLFRLQADRVPRVPLHFRTSLNINKNWLGRIFGGDEGQGYAIDDLQVLHGRVRLRLAFRGRDTDYARRQLAFLLRFVGTYGNLGARPQHGFGQIGSLILPEDLAETTIVGGLRALKRRLDEGWLCQRSQAERTPYSLRNFFHLTSTLSEEKMQCFRQPSAHFGSPRKEAETAYLPCAFDLRYKGDHGFGLRRWLRDEKGWQESDDPNKLDRLDELMGPRSQLPTASEEPVGIRDDLRTASRVCFGMPVKTDDGYRLVIFGFAPPQLLSARELSALCQEYMQQVLDVTEPAEKLGEELCAEAVGGAM